MPVIDSASREARMEKQDHYHGSLVAFEGPADVVSTQLRLLPTSPQLLILPSIQSYMKGYDDGRFSARAVISNAHKAAQARHDVAMSFLQRSSVNNKRIVFLSGGTAGAASQCISAISEHEPLEDVIEAESIFREISLDGVKGLDQEDETSDYRTLQMLDGRDEPEEQYWENFEAEDPITKAMRAADALYKKTESLQPIDCFERSRPRSLSLPMYGYADGMGEPSPFFIFGSPPDQEAQLESNTDSDGLTKFPRVVEEYFAKEHPIRSQRIVSKVLSTHDTPPSCVGEPYEPHTAKKPSTMQLLSTTTDAFLSPPATPEGVVYGEARLVQMRASAANKPLRNTRSLDDLELHQTMRSHDSAVSKAQIPEMAVAADVPDSKSRHLSIVEDPYSSNNLLHLPQARFVKAHTTTIRRSPTLEKRLPKPVRESYVHRGTDAADFDENQHALDEPFHPILPLTEDLVIHLTGETHDQVLDSVIQSYQSGIYPLYAFPSASLHHSEPTSTCPSTAITTDIFDPKDQAKLPRVLDHSPAKEPEEYDQYVARGRDSYSSSLVLRTPNSSYSAAPVYTRQLPTPSQTPPPPPSQPVMEKTDSMYYKLSIRGRPNAVVVQNTLRSVLEVYFPPQQDGVYHQLGFPLRPTLDSLWRPIFRENDAHGHETSKRKTDLILAAGCQRGVKRDFLPALMGQIEKLGAKSSGMSRSGRLDIRYGPLQSG